MESNKPNKIKLKKMEFIFNALEDGWEIKKQKGSYVFTKKHEGKEEVFTDEYLRSFMVRNLGYDKILM